MEDVQEVKQAVQGVARGIKRVATQALGVENEVKERTKGSSFALGYMGSRSIFRSPFYAKAVIEQKFDWYSWGSESNRTGFAVWAAGTAFYEFHPGQLYTGDSLGGATASGHTPTLGTTRKDRVGDQIYIDFLDLRICIEASGHDDTAVPVQCCRLVVLQLEDESPQYGPGTFKVDQFFESGNITSGYTRQIERQERYDSTAEGRMIMRYKVLIDKTFTVGGGIQAFEDKRMHLKFKLGAQYFNDNSATEINDRPGRIIWQLFSEEPTLAQRPSFYGDYRWQFRDP